MIKHLPLHRLIQTAICSILLLSAISHPVYADETISSNQMDTALTGNAGHVITEEMLRRSTDMYNNLIGYSDPYFFLLSEEGIRYNNYFDPAADEEMTYLKQKSLEITEGCTTDSEKIYAVAEYLALNICYDNDYYIFGTKDYRDVFHDPYDVLVNESAVCEGYTRTAIALLQLADIPCIFVSASNHHAWNMAYDGSRWILFDATWMARGVLENGILQKSDSIWMDWYDFSLEKAHTDDFHVVEGLPLQICDGVLEEVPYRAKNKKLIIPSTVETIDCMFSLGEYMTGYTVTIPKSVKEIKPLSFLAGSISGVCYEGTEAEYDQITVTGANQGLINCTNIVFLDNAATPGITRHPTSTETYVGGNPVVLTVEALNTHSGTTYQWYSKTKDSDTGGTPISGAVSASYTFTPDSVGEYYFYVVITNTDNTVTGTKTSSAVSAPAQIKVIPAVTATGVCGENAIWTLYAYGTLEISGTGDMYDYAWNNIPPWRDYKTSIQTIDIKEGITSIGDYTFAYLNKAASVNIPEGIQSLGYFAFAYCNVLERISIPDSLWNVSADSFVGCYQLKSVDASDTHPFFVSRDGVLFEKNLPDKSSTTLILYPAGKTDAEYTIPDDVIKINGQAFQFCHNLKSITIPAGTDTLYYSAFNNCSSLQSAYFMGDVPESFLDGNFSYCHSSFTIYYPYGSTSGWTTPTWKAPDGTVYNTAVFIPGWDADVNLDGLVNAADAAYLKAHFADPDAYPLPDGNHDFNEDGTVDVSDAAYLLWYLINHG